MWLRLPRTLGAVCAMAAMAFAQGIPDQQNDPDPTGGFGCGTPVFGNGSILQSFVPDEASLIGVEVRLRAGNQYPAAGFQGTTIRILADDPTGTVLAEATADVPGGLATAESVLVRFDFAEVTLTPGNTYLIEWVTPESQVLTWAGRGDDPYAAGTAFSCVGRTWPGGITDFNFITYAAAPEEAADCKTRLEQLLADVDGLGLKRRAQWGLEVPLRVSCMLLERGKTRGALFALYAFKVRVKVYMRMRWISHEDGVDLMGKARDLAICIMSEAAA